MQAYGTLGRPLLRFIAVCLQTTCVLVALASALARPGRTDDKKRTPGARVYANRLTVLRNPAPLLADYPEFVQPIVERQRFEAPRLIDDPRADLDVRAWRFSYNARGIIEAPNRLAGRKTAIVIVHPWGVDDGQGWKTPQPAGAAFACTTEKNRIYLSHARQVINPLLKRLRKKVKLVLYSLPGKPDSIRTRLYRTMDRTPTAQQRIQAAKLLKMQLATLPYRGQPLPKTSACRWGKSRLSSTFASFRDWPQATTTTAAVSGNSRFRSWTRSTSPRRMSWHLTRKAIRG